MKRLAKLIFITDTHYFSPTLADGKEAYCLRSGSDQKCLLETGAIIDSAFEKIKNSDCDAVIISGDLTNDGEKVCHEEIRKKLQELSKFKKVFVITATHDWCCDENPRRFENENVFCDVPTMKPEQLREFYFDFGPKQAKSEFITHLGTCSYAVDIGSNVRLLALNDDQNGKGRAGFKEDHFGWIDEQIKSANADGKVLVATEHHLLLPHIHPLLTGGSTCVGDREYVASRLADAGLKYMFVGHSHIQHVDSFTTKNGNTLFEVNVGSLCGYPAPIVEAEIFENEIKLKTKTVDSFVFGGVTYDCNAFLKKKIFDLVDRVLECSRLSKTDFEKRMLALEINPKKLLPLFPVIKPLLSFLQKETVGGVLKKLCFFGLSKNLDKRSFKMLEDMKIIDLVHEIMLSVFDGSKKRFSCADATYKVVVGTFEALEEKFGITLLTQAGQALSNILLGSAYDINDCTI